MMKIVLLTTVGLLGCMAANAQVKIGGEPTQPHSSAVLELDGGFDRGLLLPRMRKMDIDAIQNPAEGLMIYATDEQAVYIRKSLVWEKQIPFALPYSGTFNDPNFVLSLTNTANGSNAIAGNTPAGSAIAGFTQTGNGILGIASHASGLGGFFYNSHPNAPSLITRGFTGIGAGTPASLLHVNGTATTGTTIIIDDDDDPTIQWRKAGINKSFIKQQGNDLVLRPNDQNSSGKIVMQAYNDGGWMFIDASGNVSVGINPVAFTGTPLNSRFNIRSNGNNTLTLDAPATNSSGPSLQFVNKVGNITTPLGGIQTTSADMKINSVGRMDFLALANPLQVLYNWWNTVGPLQSQMNLSSNHVGGGVLNVSGSIKIGAGTQGAALHVNTQYSNFTEPVIIDAVDPMVRIKNAGVDKGFIQIVGHNVKIGTYAVNDFGNFIIRTNGSDRIVVRPDGKMVLGSPTGSAPATNHLLAAKGRIAATEFTVTALAAWPDYVFADNYKLPTLEETEAFIITNKHLPNIPAAAEIEKNGLELGDMQKRMMEKIEELTLYMIDANKSIQTLKAEINMLKKQAQAN